MEADILNHYLLCLLLVLFLLGTVILLKDVLWPPSVLLQFLEVVSLIHKRMCRAFYVCCHFYTTVVIYFT